MLNHTRSPACARTSSAASNPRCYRLAVKSNCKLAQPHTSQRSQQGQDTVMSLWSHARPALLSLAPPTRRANLHIPRSFPSEADSSAPTPTAATTTAATSRSTQARPSRVAVLGAGVVGLTSALRILQAFKGAVDVTVIAHSKSSSETTTAGAAGLWGPYKLSDTPEDKIVRWGGETYEYLMQLFHSADAHHAGVSTTQVFTLHAEEQPFPFWSDVCHTYSYMNERQLAAFPKRFASGHCWQSVTCEGLPYLGFLESQIHRLGGRTELSVVRNISHLEYDIVVNCCGLGAREVVGDDKVHPIRGQIVRVDAPWIQSAYFADPFYIIPNRNSVVLGGTGQVGDWNTNVSPEDKERIWNGCCELLPSLHEAEVLNDWVGLRPGRTQLRLELEKLGDVRPRAVVHNYGHGGAGLTLAWGCAGEVVKLIEESGLL